MRILVIEDDREAANYLIKGLSESGHVADHAADGEQGLHMAVRGPLRRADRRPHAAEAGRPGVIRKLRDDGNRTPVLILCALGEVDDRVKGLRAGGDDYLTKPYAFSELLARVEALAPPAAREARETTLAVGDLELDRLSRTVTRAGKAIVLQPREFRLLEYLMSNAGQVVTRTMLLENVWDYHFDPQTNVIDVHISRLRAKIDKGFDEPLLHTVRGAGYMIKA